MPPKAAADFRDADSCGEGEWEIDPATGLAVLDPATGLKVPKLCSGILWLNGSALGEGCHPLVVQIASIRSVTPYDCIVHVIAHHMEPLRPVFFGGLPLVTEFDAEDRGEDGGHGRGSNTGSRDERTALQYFLFGEVGSGHCLRRGVSHGTAARVLRP